MEFARDGCLLEEIVEKSRRLLGKRLVQQGVDKLIRTVVVNANLAYNGPAVISVSDPVCTEEGDLHLALYGSFLPIPSMQQFASSCDKSIENDGVVAKANVDEYVLVESQHL